VRKRIGHIPSLDGVRAISFLLVLAAHAGLDNVVPGGLGVTIFFFLSGFLITTLMRTEYERIGRVDFRQFWLRRALRILPPFYLVLSAVTIVALLVMPAGSLQMGPFLARALHFTNYWSIYHGPQHEPPGTGVYWSLAVEEHFYLLFPLLFVAVQRAGLSARSQAFTFWTLCLAVLLWRTVLVTHFAASEDRTYMGTDTRIDSILFGCALAVWCNPVMDDLRLNERIWKILVVPGAALLLLVCLLIRDELFRQTLRYSLQGVALTILFIAAIQFHDWMPFRFLNWRPIAFLGVLSYSMYLMHYAVLIGVQSAFPRSPGILNGILALCITVGLAYLMYVFVEKPCGRLRKRLSGEAVSPVAVAAVH
jgi:peptidoglycan/LPS O-acetylase OafA/YrhL